VADSCLLHLARGHQPIIAIIISRSFAASEGTEAAAKPCAPMEDDSSEEEPEQLQCKCILLGDGAVGKTSVALRFTEDYFAAQYKQTIGLDFFMKRLVLPGIAGCPSSCACSSPPFPVGSTAVPSLPPSPAYRTQCRLTRGSDAGEIQVAMQVWDIGGQSIGSKMIGNYIYGAQVVCLVYDITDYQTFNNLEDWYRMVRRTFEKRALPYVALIGNKSALCAPAGAIFPVDRAPVGVGLGADSSEGGECGTHACMRAYARTLLPCGAELRCVCGMALLPVAADLNHMRAVKLDKHNGFADENDMYSYFVSAKSGDNINSTFHRIAADWAGVVLTKPEVEITAVRGGGTRCTGGCGGPCCRGLQRGGCG
jgi:GTPase SAR1 family protein